MHVYVHFFTYVNVFISILQMIRMVPTPKLDSNFNINSDLDPNHSLEQVIHNIDTTFTDFDLSFLPKTEGDCNLDVDLGSPASSLVELSSLSPPSPVCFQFAVYIFAQNLKS